jgi:hypothetical protein
MFEKRPTISEVKYKFERLAADYPPTSRHFEQDVFPGLKQLFPSITLHRDASGEADGFFLHPDDEKPICVLRAKSVWNWSIE